MDERIEMERNCDNTLCEMYDYDRSEGCLDTDELCPYISALIRIKELEEAILNPCGAEHFRLWKELKEE